MRCLTLADALRERGVNALFICRNHPGNLLDLIRDRGFSAYALLQPKSGGSINVSPNSSADLHAGWLGVDWQKDAEQTRAILEKLQPNWLVVLKIDSANTS